MWFSVCLVFKFQNQEDSASSNPFALQNSVTPPLPTFARVTTAYGSYQDANIPFPRTSGARFCGAGWSLFGSLILDFERDQLRVSQSLYENLHQTVCLFYFLRTEKNLCNSVWYEAEMVSVDIILRMFTGITVLMSMILSYSGPPFLNRGRYPSW